MERLKKTVTDKNASEAGFVLVSALSLMAVIGLIVAAATSNFTYSSKLSLARTELSRNRLALDGVVTLISMQLLQQGTDQLSEHPGDIFIPIHCTYRDAVDVRFSIQDHDGLIDVNTASPRLIEIGFQTLGFSTDDATFIADRIIDYRDRDNVTRDGRLESSFYTNIDSAYTAKNSSFYTIFELDRLPLRQGFDFPTLARVFTVKSGLGGIDITRASRSLQTMLRQMNDTRITRRKSRNKYYSIDAMVRHKDSAIGNKLVSRSISFIELSPGKGVPVSFAAPWRVPLPSKGENNYDDYKVDASVNTGSEIPCSRILAG